ncbi:MAG: hypothetical protein IOC86_12435 [Aestuariivirga sp.]|nr:hypothetical protein [Aestuariivirga sp.]
MTVVRISLGRFDPARAEAIETLLRASKDTLVPAIRALRGSRGYHAGIDRENGAMTNVSIWASLEDAQQMASLKAMRDLAATFIEAGVRFERPITNHDVLWTV